MTNLYRPMPEALFSTPWFRRIKSVETKLVLLTLAAGPCATMCPGLAQTDSYHVAGLIGLAPDVVEDALHELVRLGVAEVDEDHRMVRLPWMPAMCGTASFKTLTGWWNNFRKLSPCEIRDRHVADLRMGVEFAGTNMAETWDATFAKVASPSQGHGKPLPSPPDHEDADEDATKTNTNTQTKMFAAEPAGSPRPRERRSAADRARSNAKAKTQSKLPYSLDELQKLLETTRRYQPSEPTEKQIHAAHAVIKKHSIDDMCIVVEWLSCGGEPWKKSLDIRNVHLGEVNVWVAKAKQWIAEGRPPLSGTTSTSSPRRGSSPPMPHVPEGQGGFVDLDAVLGGGK
jgi:hypothetical protein